MKYNYTPVRMAKIQNTDNINTDKDVEQQELSLLAVGGVGGWDANWYSHFGRQFGSFLKI